MCAVREPQARSRWYQSVRCIQIVTARPSTQARVQAMLEALAHPQHAIAKRDGTDAEGRGQPGPCGDAG